MPRSYNGWYASPDLKTRVIEPVPGCRLRIVDNDDVAVVFSYLVKEFHERVDDVTKPHPADDWGFYYRANRNDPNELSCHASGTAIDLDATEHPNGVSTSRTFTPRQIAEVHEILRELEGVVRWGGDYTRTADAMHFEIIKSARAVKAVANKIRNNKLKRRLKVVSANVQIGPWVPDLVDIRQVAKQHRPDVICMYEATKLFGHLEVEGYKAYQLAPKRLRKNSQPNTAGIAMLVKDGLPRVTFLMRMTKFWRGPKRGLLQDPRVYRGLRVKKNGIIWKVGAFHFPFGAEAQAESVGAVRSFFRNTIKGRPTIAVMDANMSKLKADTKMADPVGAELVGTGVDLALYKNCRLISLKVLPKESNYDHPWLVAYFGK